LKKPLGIDKFNMGRSRGEEGERKGYCGMGGGKGSGKRESIGVREKCGNVQSDGVDRKKDCEYFNIGDYKGLRPAIFGISTDQKEGSVCKRYS
jgi:hypothetical protein